MTAPALTEMPETFEAGTTVEYTRTLGDYPANDGWTLEVKIAGTVEALATATPSGTNFLVVFTAAITAALAAGGYQWSERVTKAGKKYTAASGHVFVTPDVVGATGGSARTHAEKMVALLRTAIEAVSTGGIQSYQVGSRSVTKYNLAEFRKLLAYYEWMVWRERNPGTFGEKVLVRFPGVES